MNLKKLLCGAVAMLGMAVGPMLAADIVSFDADGVNADEVFKSVDELDWIPSAGIAKPPKPIGSLVKGDVFNFYLMTKLTNDLLLGTTLNPFNLNNTALGGSGYELTLVTSFEEKVVSVVGGIITLKATAGSPNFFAVYYDDVIDDGTDGDGPASDASDFVDGTLVLSGSVTAATSIIPVALSPILSGSVTAVSKLSYVDASFFTGLVAGDTAISFGTIQFPTVGPFVDYAAAFDGSLVVPGAGSSVFKVDLNTIFDHKIPEPSTVVLMGLGVLGMIVARRRAAK